MASAFLGVKEVSEPEPAGSRGRHFLDLARPGRSQPNRSTADHPPADSLQPAGSSSAAPTPAVAAGFNQGHSE